MPDERTLRQAGMREAHIVAWRVGNGKYHTEAFETREGAEAFVQRHQVKGRIYKGIVMTGLFPPDRERANPSEAAVEAAQRAERGEKEAG